MLVSVQIFMLSFIMLFYIYKYVLVMLMLMELVVVNISLVMYVSMSVIGMEFYLIYYLIFSVCEGVLGLSLLVQIIRYYGSDMYYSLNVSKF